MLTNLDFLKPGSKFPPKSEEQRLEMYRNNRDLFESKHALVYEKEFKRIERIIGNFDDVISYPVVLNFQKLMSLKIADLLFGEPPHITSGKPESKEQLAVDTIETNSDLNNTSYMGAIDVSRFGDGLLYVRQEGDKGIIDLTQPPYWFPVVDPGNIRKRTHNVLAWTTDDDAGTKTLNVQIHTIGKLVERTYKLDGNTIGAMIGEEKETATNLSDHAIIQIPNVLTSDRVTGMDDYTDLDSLISDLIVRVGQIDRILDKHANPSMTGPLASLEKDPRTGEWRIKAGSYFIRNASDDPEVKYVVWDGQLDANFKQIERLINLIYTISEMGSALFGDMSQSGGQIPSGSALRRLLIAPLAKVNRIRMRFDSALKKAICLCSELGGTDVVKLKDISIQWNDGLPGDPEEEAKIMKTRTADAATMSVKRALMTYDGMNEKDADEEIATILDEAANGNPLTEPPFSQGKESTEPDLDEEGNQVPEE